MTHFFRSGRAITIGNDRPGDILTSLPPGNYSVKFVPPPMGPGFFLEETEPFTLPKKIYGDTKKQSERILHSFRERASGTGALLVGEKGSGKSLLAKKICVDSGLPVLLVNNAFGGEMFNTFMASINQPCCVLFDEFEKTYREDYDSRAEVSHEDQMQDGAKQSSLLTLLDGVFTQKKLFLLTCNDFYRVNRHMKNRPGRLFYLLNFGGLDAKFIREYCADALEDKGKTEEIVQFAFLFRAFSFDMLQALVEELNRFKCSVAEAAEVLNVKPSLSDGENVRYSVELFLDGKQAAFVSPNPFMGSPLTSGPIKQNGGNFYLNFYMNLGLTRQNKPREPHENLMLQGGAEIGGRESSAPSQTITFNVNQLVRIDHDTGMMVFRNEAGAEARFTRMWESSYVYRGLDF